MPSTARRAQRKPESFQDVSATVFIEPMGKPTMTHADKWKGREVVDRYWSFCDAVREAFQRVTKFYSADKIVVVSHFKTDKKSLWGKPHTIKPDATNILKGVEDALVKNDQTISSVLSEKFWADRDYIDISLFGVSS